MSLAQSSSSSSSSSSWRFIISNAWPRAKFIQKTLR
jgi:hypothetical protein